ncbi:MAG: hypothetical protein AAB721_01690 [Patescibacteria group bacterium]
MINFYNEDELYISSLEEIQIEEGIENLKTLSQSGYKLNPTQREHLICMGIDPDNFEELEDEPREDFLEEPELE